MLSYNGWLEGITALGVVIFGFIFGLFFIYKSKKIEAKLLFCLGLTIIFTGLMYLGPSLDFLTILLTGNNLDNRYGLYAILSYIWFAPLAIFAIYIGAELILPEKKWYIISIYLILSIIFELLLFLDTMNSFIFKIPSKPGEDIIDSTLVFVSPLGILFLIFIISMLIVLGFGFLYQCIQTSGETRKKFLLLSIGIFLYITFGTLEGLTEPGIALIFIRIGYICSPWFMYLGLKD